MFAVAVVALPLLLANGCTEKLPTEGEVIESIGSPDDPISPVTQGQYWGDRVVSEAFYALSQSRSGGSNVSYHGNAMSDWNYVESDRDADQRVSYQIGGCENRGDAGGVRRLRDWNGQYKYCHQGGICKYFINLILYRSSYGWGGGRHLYLPSGYGYATGSVNVAQPGWVIQRPYRENPDGSVAQWQHTALVVERLSYGLDVIDSNMIAPNTIARHSITWQDLATQGYKSFNPWSDPVNTIPQNGPRTRCY